jgi:hypothetical protein
MIPELQQSEWPDHFEAVAFPRGNLVVGFPQRKVEASLPTMLEAERLSAALNRWLLAKPTPSLVPHLPDFSLEEYELRLVEMLATGLGPEQRAEALKAELS